MAQVARLTAPTSVSASPANARGGAPARQVASPNGGSVEALSPSLGGYLDGAGLLFQDYRGSFSDSGFADGRLPPEGRQQVPLRSPRLSSSSNPHFASMLETYQEGRTDQRVLPQMFPSHFKGPTGQAVRQYELNARIIAGTENLRGGSINLTL
jgi:hypothetical protein